MILTPLFRITPFFCLLVFLVACSDERDIRDYYFPVRDLRNGLVYAYEPLAGPDTNTIYWYALGLDQDTSLMLNLTTYGPDFTPTTLISEKITNQGVVTKQVYLYSTDSTGSSERTQAEVLAGNSFPFLVPKGPEQPAYVYKISYEDKELADVSYRITYNRQFSRDTSFMLGGIRYAAIVLDITGETAMLDDVNGDIAPRFTGFEIYARDVGLVESYRNFDGGFAFHQRLKERFPMSELQQRAAEFKQQLDDAGSND